jgi:hypothetical protein
MKVFNKDEYVRMCADIMGFKVIPDSDNQCFEHENHPWDVFHISDFHYDEDWNEIMEVVEEIEKKFAWVNIKGCSVDITNEISVSKTTKKMSVIHGIWLSLLKYNENKFGNIK